MSSKWPLVRLGEVIQRVARVEAPVPGTMYRQIGVKLWGGGAYERDSIDGGSTKYSQLFRVEAGDIIVNKIWARNGSVAVVPFSHAGCYASGEFPIFSAKHDRLDPRWIHWLTKTHSFWAQCDEKSRGTSGKNRIRPERFLEIEIPLPPLAEQRRIVARIEELAAEIEETQKLRQSTLLEAEALFIAVLRNLTASLSPTGTLGDILLSPPRNGWSARCNNADDGIPILSLSAITGFRYRPQEHKRTSLIAATSAHYWLRPGDILISRSNTLELVGHAAIYDGNPSPCIYPDLMMRLEPDDSKVERKFIWYWLQCPLARDFIRQHAKGTSASMKKISQGTVMAIPFPSHLPVTDQRRIVAELDALQSEVDRLKALQAETAAELDALLPAILDRAFKGEL